jgi:SulP family sulfate permease
VGLAESNKEQPGEDRISIFGDAVGAVALTMYSVTASVSFAALVFTGAAADGLPRGAATFVFTSGLITLVLGLRTRFPLAFGVVQDTGAIVLVPAVAVIAADGSDDPVRDVFVVLALSSALTGALMWLLGRAGLAGTARFMPTTVVAGFLAGTGWLLAKGGVEVMTGHSLELGDLDNLLQGDVARFWLPGVALGLVITVVPLIRRLPALVSSVATVVSVIAFFAVVAVASSLDAVEGDGWLLGPFPDGDSVGFVNRELADASWSSVAAASGQIGVLLILSLLGVLLNISGIQTLLRKRIDLDAEMRTIGLANLAIAPIGGLVGYHGLGDSALAHRLGVRGRFVPLAVGAATVVFAFFGAGLIGYLPKFAAGGLLIGAGIGLLIRWVRELRSTASWLDRAVSVLILGVICFVGILEGIVVGIVAACVFFVVRYSRIDAVRVVSTGAERRSVVERSSQEGERLDAVAGRLAVYELHGSLFFGSVSGVAGTIRERLARTAAPVEVVIVDFDRVADIDSSAFAVLVDLADDVSQAGATLLWSGLSDDAVAVLGRIDSSSAAIVVDGLDAALEVAEDGLLARHVGEPCVDEGDGVNPYSDDLLAWFETRHHNAGDEILREGDPGSELVVVATGSVHVSRANRTGGEIRLRTSRAGAIIGEIGFLSGAPRTATVTAESDVELLVLTADSHARLREEQPGLVLELYDRVLRSTADLAAAINRSLTQALR